MKFVRFLSWLRENVTLKDIIYIFFIILILIALSCSISTCQNNNRRYNNNLHSLLDTITYYQSENGALVASRTAFESNIEELKLANSELYKELSDMKVRLRNISSAVHVGSELVFEKTDTIIVVKEKEQDGSFIQPFDLSNQWRTLNGNISYDSDSSLLGLSILNDKVRLDYTIVMDKDNKIYVKSDNPYVTYNELAGFTIPKPRKTTFSIGPSIGVGYGIVNRKPDVFVGLDVSWKFIEI